MCAARMAAWRVHAYGACSELRLESARVPALRAPDDVLVRVRAASVNPLDVAMLGGYGARVLNALRAADGEFPLVAGRDFSGTVARAGPGARLRRGAAVWGVVPPHRAGAHAQYVLVKDRWVADAAGSDPWREGRALTDRPQAGPAPRALPALAAGGAPFAALSAGAVLRAAGLAGAAARGARVLLLGLGGAGQAALQLLAAAGARTAVGCAPELRPLALRLGAELALDRTAADYDAALVDCGPYDAIVDCAGLGGAEAGARRWRFARYATLSSPLLRRTDGAGLLAGALGAGAELLAQARAARRRAPGACAPVRWAYFAPAPHDLELLRRLAERGQFSVHVERVFGWWEADRAYERLARGHARGKLLLDFDAARPHDEPPAVEHATAAVR